MQTAIEPVTVHNRSVHTSAATAERMHLRYGLNLGDQWPEIVGGPSGKLLLHRIREAGSMLVRVFLNCGGKSPLQRWPECEALLEGIQQSGAVPMIATGCPSPWQDPQAISGFAQEYGQLASRCVDRWGPEAVGAWFWSIGDEPNSPWTNGGLTFEGYRDYYEAVASAITRQLGPHWERRHLCRHVGGELGGTDAGAPSEPCTNPARKGYPTDLAVSGERPHIGGPCVDGFQPFWYDWIWRFVEDVDDSLIGFVAWNRYGDWREPGAWSAPADPGVFERLLLSRTTEYWSRAAAVNTLLEGRGILNICSELNAHSHTDRVISARFNQGVFGAVYYASALIELMRGGADGECLWAAGCDGGPYGAIDMTGNPTPTYAAKRLIAQHVRFEDRVSFLPESETDPGWDAMVGISPTGKRIAVVIHRSPSLRHIDLSCWPELGGFSQITLLGEENGGLMRRQMGCGELCFEGYGVALLEEEAASRTRLGDATIPETAGEVTR